MMEGYVSKTNGEVIDDKVNISDVNNKNSSFMKRLLEIQRGYSIESLAAVTKMYRIFRDNADINCETKSKEERKQMALKNTETYFKVHAVIKDKSNPMPERLDDDYL